MNHFERTARRILAPLALLSLAIAVIACRAPDPGPGRTPGTAESSSRALTDYAAFTQAQFIDSTCDAQQSKIRDALAVLHGQMVVDPGPMISCLSEAVFQGPFYGQEPDGHHAEWVVELMTRTAPPIAFSCTTPSGPSFGSAFWAEDHVQLAPGPLATNSVARVAADILHEVGHMFAFDHSIDIPLERDRSIPYQLEQCSQQVSNGANPPKPLLFGEDRLSDFPDEVSLQPVGHRSDVASYTLALDRDFKVLCPGNKFSRGIGGFADFTVQGLGMLCLNADGSDLQFSNLIFGSGDFFQQHCFENELMIGLWGQAGMEVNSIGPVCASRADVLAGIQGTFFQDPAHGIQNNVDPFWTRICPPRMAVRALKGHFGVGASEQDINSIQVVCQDVTNPRSLSLSVVGGINSPSTLAWTTEECAGRGAMNSLSVTWDGSGVTRLGGFCRNYSGNGAGITKVGFSYPLPGIGGGGVGQPPGYDDEIDWCEGQNIMVGIDVNVKNGVPHVIRGVRGVCANAQDWAAPASASSPTITLPARGPVDGDNWVSFRCANTELLHGLRIRAEWWVDQIFLLCRSFQ
jgi:hypothetical protein